MADQLVDDVVLRKDGAGDRSSMVNLYFREAGRHPLLSPAEEGRLCRKLAFCYRVIAVEISIDSAEDLSFKKTVAVAQLSQRLTSRSRRAVCKEVVYRRYGIETQKEETLQLISESLGISRERVRQIEKNALKKIAAVYRQSASSPDGSSSRLSEESYH